MGEYNEYIAKIISIKGGQEDIIAKLDNEKDKKELKLYFYRLKNLDLQHINKAFKDMKVNIDRLKSLEKDTKDANMKK